MPIDKWPCFPTDLESLFPGDLPRFLQAGVNHVIGRAVSLIDPISNKRFDSFNRFDGFQPFCLKLRSGLGSNIELSRNRDKNCTNCDLHMARCLTKKFSTFLGAELPLIKYRCYMGLEEYATVISVGGLRIMMVTGQFIPSTGAEDIKQILSCLGKRVPQKTEVSTEMWNSISEYQFPEDLWTSGEEIPEQYLTELFRLADKLEPCNTNIKSSLITEAKRIQEIAEQYYKLATEKVEANIIQDLTLSLANADPSNSQQLWNDINHALTTLNERFDFRYSAYFSGHTEDDTELHLRARAGYLPEEFGAKGVHFNWRKSGIKSNDERDSTSHIFNWHEIGFVHTTTISKGLKGVANTKELKLITALIPVKLSKGPFGLLVLGAHNQVADLSPHESFILLACRDFCTRILTLQLSNILIEDRGNWEKTAKLSGHRLRSSIQSISSQIKTINAFNNGDPCLTLQDRESAEADLNLAFKNLTELSYAAESSIPGTLDVKSVSRDVIPIIDILLEAIATQEDLAEQFGITISISDEIRDLPSILVNRTLIRSAFINLINNGLKYSYPRQQDRKRMFRIKPSYKLHDFHKTVIEFVNYGLGVKEEDRERIFEWGTRLSEGNKSFKEVYGKGIGLWEVKHIIEGHGGRVFVDSVHPSKIPITEQNLKQCVTVFTVEFPTAESI
jgi:signal transduction histidine kinase